MYTGSLAGFNVCVCFCFCFCALVFVVVVVVSSFIITSCYWLIIRQCACVYMFIFSSPLVVAAAAAAVLVNSFCRWFFCGEYRVTDTWNPLNTFVVRTLLFINLNGCLPAGLLFLFCLLLLMKPRKVSVSLCFWFSSSRAHVNQILSLKYNFTGFNNYI